MSARLRSVVAMSLVVWLGIGLKDVEAQVAQVAQPPDTNAMPGWSNTTDLSLVVTEGNSTATTVGFSHKMRYVWSAARFAFDLSGVRSNTSDDRFFVVDSGLEYPIGGALSNPPASVVTPEPTLDVSNYTIKAAYEKTISPKLFWNGGASWYRNDDAGILNRWVEYGGVGNKWADSDRRRFTTSYGISYTDREEEEPDPEKDRRFGGARLGWDYTEKFTATTTFDSDFSTNVNLVDPSDYSLSTLNALTVSINNHVSLKLSAQWLFENEPALESDLDVVAYVEVVNPDGVPSSGDERFRTLASGGTKVILGESDARKGPLDTVVRTALVIKF